MMTPVEGADAKDIAILGIDHPGAQDPLYRERRNEIAATARRHRVAGLPPPRLDYTAEEHATWRTVTERLADLHESHASERYLSSRATLPISTKQIPQLADLSESLKTAQGFTLRAIEGLIAPQSFLSVLSERVMSCTQYIRHASRPEYTPEPDVVHEVIGHVPLFADADFAALSQEIGRAASVASGHQIEKLDRLYWYTLEFGLVEEGDAVKAYGAGLLSSFGELPHAFSADVNRKPFDIEEAVSTPYDFSNMQALLYVVPSFKALHDEVRRFLASPLYTR